MNRRRTRQVLECASLLALWQSRRAKAPEDWRSPRRYRAIRRFMVLMQGIKIAKAIHESKCETDRGFQ